MPIQETIYSISLIIVAYLLGAIPTSVWVSRLFYKTDVRDFGSGNAGATNTYRTLGIKAAIPVLLFDVFKGIAAVNLIVLFDFFEIDSEFFLNMRIYLGFAAVFGHIFPIYVGFRGGKGVATLIGIGFALLPYACLASIGVFVIVFIISKYVSLGSIISGIAFALFTAFIFPKDDLQYLIFSITISILLIITHHENIRRIFKGEENKFSFSKKKNQ